MISVIVPIYNMERYLKKCVDSLLIQNADFELILIDDGSTDKSLEICNHYADKFPELIKVIHKDNQGLSETRNLGISVAKGEFIIFPDPDDWVEPNYLSKMNELYQINNVDLVCIGYFVDNFDGTVFYSEESVKSIFNKVEAQRALLIRPRINGFVWNKLFRLDIIKENNLTFLNDVGTTEDLDFVFRYLQYCNKVVFSSADKLYHYFQREGSATYNKFSPKMLESIKTYEKILKSSNDIVLISAAKEEICNTLTNIIWLLKKDNINDSNMLRNIKNYSKKYLPNLLKSKNYGLTRKIQAILSIYATNLYILIKNKINN